MASNITIKDTGELKSLRGLKFDMTVGVHAQEGVQPHTGSGMTVAEVTNLHEFGADKIPARKWMRTWAHKQSNNMAGLIHKALVPLARKQDFSNPRELQGVAERMKDSMREVVLSGSITPKNAPVTLAKKSPETRPLVESGQMVNAVEAEIKGGPGWNRSTR